jgi:ketosteroid isomerase-like protein
MGDAENRAVIERYFHCINHEDWDGLAELWHDDAEFRVTAARPRSGKEDVLRYYPKALAPFPEHWDEPTRIIVAGNTVTVEIDFIGRTADGRPVEFPAVDIFDLEDGKIRNFSSWFDIELIRKQTS